MNNLKPILPLLFALFLALPLVAKSNSVKKAAVPQPQFTVASVCAKINDEKTRAICNEYSDTAEFAAACTNFSSNIYNQSLCFRNARSAEFASACRAMTKDDYRASNCLSLAKSIEHVKACGNYYAGDTNVLDACLKNIDNDKQVKTCIERSGDKSPNEKIDCLTIARYEEENSAPASSQAMGNSPTANDSATANK